MPDVRKRLERVRVMDKRVHHEDGTWSGDYFYEWSCRCKIHIPVFRDGSLGAGHRDEFCPEHLGGCRQSA